MKHLHLKEPPESHCLLRLSAIGDVCHAVPMIRTLQAAWPEPRLTWIIGREAIPESDEGLVNRYDSAMQKLHGILPENVPWGTCIKIGDTMRENSRQGHVLPVIDALLT